MNAPDQRPNSDDPGAVPLKTAASHQLPQLDEPEVLAKVLPAGGPLLGVSRQWLATDTKAPDDCRRCPGCTNPGACHDGEAAA